MNGLVAAEHGGKMWIVAREMWIVARKMWIVERKMWIVARVQQGKAGPHRSVVKAAREASIWPDMSLPS